MRPNQWIIKTLCLSVLIFTATTFASELTVPGTYPTIQAAINAAFNGDTITVFPGTYYENINFNGKNIVLTSVNPDDLNIVESTIIDRGSDFYSSVVTFSGTETFACVKGFKICNGVYEGGIKGNGTLATISNCIITENTFSRFGYEPTEGGGGLYNCDGLIVHCVISSNKTSQWTADDIGLLWAGGWGGGLNQCDGMIRNCTITGNRAGIFHAYGGWANGVGGGLYDCNALITDCIIWGNEADYSGDQLYNSSTPTYSYIQDWSSGGIGNIGGDPNIVNPLFADVANGDFHLKSQYGRWQPGQAILNNNGTPSDPNDDFWETVQWVIDSVTSPCIDAGDPASAWQDELWPNGGRINMGAYGGTSQASMSGNTIGNIADLDHDNNVDMTDFALFSEDWLTAENLLDIDLDRNGVVDLADFADFAAQWLWVEP
jgi:hypothetical protein